jgi:hypothetical protein
MYFAPGFSDIIVHFTTYLIKEIKLLGLLFLHQMYAYELQIEFTLRAAWYKDIVQRKPLCGP